MDLDYTHEYEHGQIRNKFGNFVGVSNEYQGNVSHRSVDPKRNRESLNVEVTMLQA